MFLLVPCNSFYLSFFISTCLFAFFALFYSARAGISIDTPHPYAYIVRPASNSTLPGEDILEDTNVDFGMPFELQQASSFIPPQSLTAILPILPDTLQRTTDLLQPFLESLEYLREVVIVCPDSISADVRRQLQRTFASLGSADHPDVSLRPWQGYFQVHTAALKIAAEAPTDWVLVMDESGLAGMKQFVKWALLHPPNVSVPYGPQGKLLPVSAPTTPSRWGQIQLARYIYPPFVMSSSLVSTVDDEIMDMNPWVNFGMHVSKGRADPIGGLLLLGDSDDPFDTQISTHLNELDDDFLHSWEIPLSNDNASDSSSSAPSPVAPESLMHSDFIFFLPSSEDLEKASALICKLLAKEPRLHIRILVYEADQRALSQSNWKRSYLEIDHCVIKYDILTNISPLSFSSTGSTILSAWLSNYSGSVGVVFALQEMDPLVGFLISKQQSKLLEGATVIRIPRMDLEYAEWMSSLSLEEWKNWHKPLVDISIITKDRPESLLRLLKSLSNARYFGDHLDLRVNVEQDCDADSLRIVENITWPFGRLFIHHRIVHGGLLPAVVESWYPQNNNSYGLLLEDDVELSPLSYAWIKMTLLRYRYGDASNRIPHMFGVSLYQQKNLELPLEGRQPFNPRSLFSRAGFPHPNTPYFSQVPCSWGAVYFPEQWREFHDYLSVRLAEVTMMIEDEVVPNVRSNHWSKSWKKFFIELVYLRGYVMLYPNYENFVSLSTNHLEVGSHVKVRSQEKQDLFLLPLMQLPQPREPCNLLDLPVHGLPSVDSIPVLNLTGFLTSRPHLISQGCSRRKELLGCDFPADLYDVQSLLCINTSLASGLFR